MQHVVTRVGDRAGRARRGAGRLVSGRAGHREQAAGGQWRSAVPGRRRSGGARERPRRFAADEPRCGSHGPGWERRADEAREQLHVRGPGGCARRSAGVQPRVRARSGRRDARARQRGAGQPARQDRRGADAGARLRRQFFPASDAQGRQLRAEEARRHGVELRTAAAALARFDEAIAAGWGDADFAAVAEAIAGRTREEIGRV